MKPIIGIVVAVNQHEKDVVTIEAKYMHLIEKSGGIPILFPIYREGLIPHEKLLSAVDGIFLTGSFILKDRHVRKKLINPKLTLREINPVYYDYCMTLIKKSRKYKKPVIGVCRGMQLLAEEAGGKVELPKPTNINHKQTKKPFNPHHNITVNEGSLLYKYCGEKMKVNSFHKQVTVRTPDNYKIVARSGDGHAEAIEYKDLDRWFSLGFQFHPEWLFELNPQLQKIFRLFISKSLNINSNL
jgi:putative glutamine amidotransferase